MDSNATKTSLGYGKILLWLLAALLLATGIAYLLIRPFVMRVPAQHHSTLNVPGLGPGPAIAGRYTAGVARSINITGMPSTTGYVRRQATHFNPAA